MVRVYLDTMGGDHPEENLKAIDFFKENTEKENTEKDQTEVEKTGNLNKKYDDLEIIPVSGKDGLDSIEKAYISLKNDESPSALVSMGDTKSLVIGAMNHIGMTNGIVRPPFCPVISTFDGNPVGICDSGAIINPAPEYLLQYAKLGSEYMRSVYDIENPRVGLLNIGTEEDKGDKLHREAYELLKACTDINFEGNMESREFLSGKFDLVVCDGFSGNVMLKAIEGVGEGLLRRIYKYLPKEELQFMNYHNYGGSALLGVKKPVIKVHGSSDALAVWVAIGQAYKYAKALNY